VEIEDGDIEENAGIIQMLKGQFVNKINSCLLYALIVIVADEGMG